MWLPDILIEYRGMSIVTALFFSGLFFLYGIGWMYLRERFATLEGRLEYTKVQIHNAQDNISSMKTDIAIVRQIVEKADMLVDRAISDWKK